MNEFIFICCIISLIIINLSYNNFQILDDIKLIFKTYFNKKDYSKMKLYIAVLDEVPDFIVPTLVAHTVLGAHNEFEELPEYQDWLANSFKKCVVRVSQKEFDKISKLQRVYLGHEIHTLDGKKSCAIPLPCENEELPNVLKFAKLWSPKQQDVYIENTN